MEHDYSNPELFEQIVLDYQNLLYTVCFNIVQDSFSAENLAQETFLTAYRSLSSFRGDNLKAWLCRIAVNKSIDFRRKNSKLIFEEFDENTVTPDDSVENCFEEKERAEKLKAILKEIPEKYSSVIHAFYFERFAVKEIARRRNLPEKTIETQLYRARKLIKERWGDDDF
jgi:RNA polymerase sigma-70 factor (ECF subfamily)